MKYLIIAFAFFGLSACATVNNSSGDHFRVDSVPQGAKVTTTVRKGSVKSNQDYETEYYGCEPTPCAISLPRQSRFIATVTHPGYEPAEIFIGNSSRAGSFSGSMAATTAGVAGAVAGTGVTSAAVAAVSAEIGSIVLTSVANSLTFGAVPVSSTAIAPTVTTSSAMAAALPPALAVTGGMLLIDAASGANKNLFPNPIVLGLVPEGGVSKVDPFALLYKEELRLSDIAAKQCVTGPMNDKSRVKSCNAAKQAVKDIRKKQKEVRDLVRQASKEAAKAAKNNAKSGGSER